jgi:hypothetical protein
MGGGESGVLAPGHGGIKVNQGKSRLAEGELSNCQIRDYQIGQGSARDGLELLPLSRQIKADKG